MSMYRETPADILRRRKKAPVMGSYGRPLVTEDEINSVMSAEERAAETERLANAPIDPRFPEKQESQADPAGWQDRLASPTPGAATEAEMIRDPELEQAAAALGQRPGSIPAQVGQAVTGAAVPPPVVDNRDADELAAAQEADRQARNSQRFELAGKQFVSGVTQTPLASMGAAAPSQVPRAQAAAKSRAERAAELVRQKRQGRQDERQDRLDVEGKDERALGRSERAAALVRAAAAKAESDAESKRRFEVSHGDAQANAAATRSLAGANFGLSKERFEAEKADKAEKLGEDIPPGFEISAGASPGKETRRDFSKLVTTAERMKGLTAQMREALKGTTGAGRVLDPSTRTRLKQLSTQIQIEAKDVAGLGALSGPDMALMEQMASDPTSITTNLTVDMPTMLGQLDKWADNSVGAKSKGTGIVRSGAKAGAGAPAGSKSVGGVTYEKRADGKWYPVGGQ